MQETAVSFQKKWEKNKEKMREKYIFHCICTGLFSTKTERQSGKYTKNYVLSMDELLQCKTHWIRDTNDFAVICTKRFHFLDEKAEKTSRKSAETGVKVYKLTENREIWIKNLQKE